MRSWTFRHNEEKQIMEACDLNHQKNVINLSRLNRPQTNGKQTFVGNPKLKLGNKMWKLGWAAKVI